MFGRSLYRPWLRTGPHLTDSCHNHRREARIMLDSAGQSPMTGAEYLASLDDGREVYIYGERVAKVTEHPAGQSGEGVRDKRLKC
jgi:hypothetical protein